MTDQLVPLGFEVGSGKPVSIPVAHMIVTGMTQRAGKTTAMEGLIHRSGLRALAFRTKRGESAFEGARVHAPFFRERADWQFVEAILGAVMRQGMKFERAWVIKATRAAANLADVRRKARLLMQQARGNFDRDMFMLLTEYLDIVVPLIDRLPNVPAIKLAPGINVMDLIEYPTELQMLVLHSSLEWIHDKERGVVALVPETWKFVPQKRESPVKLAAIALAREGAGLRNFLWADSQDLAAVDKEIVRGARVYLLGVQRERNEIKRTLDHIPSGVKKPKADALATLGLGQFFACWDDQLVKVYVQPAWADAEHARSAARFGDLLLPPENLPMRMRTLEAEFVERVGPPVPLASTAPVMGVRLPDYAELPVRPIDPEPKEPEMSSSTDAKLDTLIALITAQQTRTREPARVMGPADDATVRKLEAASKAPVTNHDLPEFMRSPEEDALFDRFKLRLLRDPIVLQVLTAKPEMEVLIERTVITVDGKTLKGRVAQLVGRGFFETARKNGEVSKEVNRTGPSAHPSNVLRELKGLVELGFLSKTDGERFQVVPEMVVNIVDSGGR